MYNWYRIRVYKQTPDDPTLVETFVVSYLKGKNTSLMLQMINTWCHNKYGKDFQPLTDFQATSSSSSERPASIKPWNWKDISYILSDKKQRITVKLRPRKITCS